MPTLRTNLPDLYLDRLAYLEDVLFSELPIEDGISQQILKVRETTQPIVRTTTVASFGTVPVKQEGANVVYDELAQGYDKAYTMDTYELGFRTSKEALDDEQEEIVSQAARELGSSMFYTYEVDHANLFNNGFTDTAGSPDGVTLFSTAHPLVGGGTVRNRPTTDSDLSIDSLRVALNDIADLTDDAGKLIHWRPKVLLVPYELKWLAKEITDSPDRPDTAERAINAMRGEGLVVMAWPYLTDADAWFLLAEPEKHEIRTYWRERPNVYHDWDFDSSSMKVKIRSRWVRGWSNYPGSYGNAGA